jgi:hypothetical protein
MNEEKQVVEKTSKERFFKGRGRHFAIPKSCFVLFVLPVHEWKKLSKWIQKNDHVTIALSSNEEVFLFNDTELAKWHVRKT